MTIHWNTDMSLRDAQMAYRCAHVEALPGLDKCRVSLDILPDDSSYRYRALMETPMIFLKFALPEFIEIPVGAWVEFLGQTYYLRNPEDIKKQGTRNIEYTLNLYDRSAELGDYKLRNIVDRRMKFSMCAKPHEFIQLIVDNLNERDGDIWEVGTAIDSNEKTIEFNHVYIADGLQTIADEFKTEWQIQPNDAPGKFKVSLGKVELCDENGVPFPPLPLGYGRENGFVPGVGRTANSDEKPIKRLYVQGGERNIDRSKNLPSLYRGTANEGDTTSAALLLPIGKTLSYDGEHFDTEDGLPVELNPDTIRTYQADEFGYGVERIDPEMKAVREDSLDLSEIYPKRVGHVSEVRLGSEVSEEYARKEHFYDIVDDSLDIPDYSQYLIKGETMTIIFQSGMLAGREFEVEYIHDPKGNVPGHRFKIVPVEIDGITMPDPETGFFPKAAHGTVGDTDYYPGDEYAVFGVMLPDSYICDNATKTGASWDMFREAVKYLYEHEDQKFTFTGELQGLWAKRNWGLVGGYMNVGAYILFTDDQFATDGVKIRVVGIKEFLNNPYAPTIEISNDVGAASTVSTRLRDADNAEVVIGDTKAELKQFTQRRFRDAVESLSAIQEAMGGNFSSAINPVTLQTMAALIGDDSLQFVLGQVVDDEFRQTEIDIRWDAQTNCITAPACWLKHLTLGQNTITTQERRDNIDWANCPMWQMPAWQSGAVASDIGRLYLYAVCPADSGQTTYNLSLVPQSLKQGDDYNFLVGILSSEYEGERSFVKVYGFTEILPGRITTDKLISTDGESYLDLDTGALQLGEWLRYNTNNDHALHLKFLLSENAQLANWIFRDGKLWSQSGGCYLDGLTGDIATTGIVFKKAVRINKHNANEYLSAEEIEANGTSITVNRFDLFRAGSLIIIDELPKRDGILAPCLLPSIYHDSEMTDAERDEIRKYLGTKLYIYNNSEDVITMTGNSVMEGETSGTSVVLSPNCFVKLDCRLRSYNNKEEIYWLRTSGRFR